MRAKLAAKSEQETTVKLVDDAARSTGKPAEP
jgi:hypothetical protein